jgi:CheY-like chemotaxis protein/HPt (histidine-containing phosphotransfer) domain-containing protein
MRAVIVDSGEAALELLAKGEGPDVVLMDFHMPGIDGLEATRQLRALERETGRRAIVIGVTASAMAADRAACTEAGMDDFLAKPVSLVTLGATLGRWVHGGEDHERSHAVDRQVLDDLAVDLGEQVVVIDLVRTYLAELPARRTAVVAASEAGDVSAAKRAAHLLRSCSLLLGAIELGDACRQMAEIETVDEVRAQALAIRDRSLDAAAWFGRWLERAPLASR